MLHALADPPQAVLHAVQRIGDLVGDARHELADAQHLLFLPDGGVGPIDVAADRGGEVDRDPQGPAEGKEQPGELRPVQRRRAGPIGREVDGVARNPVQVFQEDDSAHRGVDHGRQDRRHPAAEVHAGDDHVEEKEEQERIAGQVGEIDQERQGGQVQHGLQEDVLLRIDLAGHRLALVPEEGQVIAEHGQRDDVQRQRQRHHVQDRRGQPDHEEHHRAGDPSQRDEPAGAFGGKFHFAAASQFPSACRKRSALPTHRAK